LEKKVRERRGSTSSIEIVVELMHGFLIQVFLEVGKLNVSKK